MIHPEGRCLDSSIAATYVDGMRYEIDTTHLTEVCSMHANIFEASSMSVVELLSCTTRRSKHVLQALGLWVKAQEEFVHGLRRIGNSV